MKRKELDIDGVFRMVEGIILRILDNISISGKWLKRDISFRTLEQKRIILKDMQAWLKSAEWDIWLDIYCDYFSRNKYTINRNFERIRKKSVTYVNNRIKQKIAQLLSDEIHPLSTPEKPA